MDKLKNKNIHLEMKNLSRKQEIFLSFFLISLAFIFFVFIAYSFLPVHEDANPPITWGWGVDWKGTIRLGSLDLIAGHTPYTSVVRCQPPWVYLAISPFALLPPAVGAAAIFVLSYLVYSFVLYRLKAKPWVIFAFLLNSFAFTNAKNGNLDFLAALGFILPPQIGLFFVLTKPQIGIGIAIFWFFEAWRKGRWREVFYVFAPVSIAYLLSFLIYGFWPLMLIGEIHDIYNASLWPIGIPVGILLLYKSIRDRNALFAMGASPFLAPYVNITSFAVVLFPFIPNTLLFLIGVALTWR